MAGIDVPEVNGQHPVHGVSLVDHLRYGGEIDFPERSIFWDLFGKMGAAKGDWKLVGTGPNHRGFFADAIPEIEALQFELYRLDQDIGEADDLAGQHPEVYDGLKRDLITWFQQATT